MIFRSAASRASEAGCRRQLMHVLSNSSTCADGSLPFTALYPSVPYEGGRQIDYIMPKENKVLSLPPPRHATYWWLVVREEIGHRRLLQGFVPPALTSHQ